MPSVDVIDVELEGLEAGRFEEGSLELRQLRRKLCSSVDSLYDDARSSEEWNGLLLALARHIFVIFQFNQFLFD